MTHAQMRFLNLRETPAKPEKFRLVKEQTSIANTPMHRPPKHAQQSRPSQLQRRRRNDGLKLLQHFRLPLSQVLHNGLILNHLA